MYHISTMRRFYFLSTCIPNAVANYLLFQYQWSLCLRSITTPWQDWCMWVLRSAGETDRLPGCTLWTLTKLELNIQCTRSPMHWELQTSSLEGCIAYWNMNNRQTDRMKGQIFVSKQAWMTVTSSIKWTALCVCCTQSKFTLNQLTDRIRDVVSGSKDETKGDVNDSAQWCYQMNWTLCVHVRLRSKTMLIILLNVDAP